MAWMAEAPRTAAAKQVLVLDADPALFSLLDEWLGDAGFRVAASAGAIQSPDLVIVDVRDPRGGGAQLLRRVKHAHPGVPVLAISANFFAEIASTGAVARALGVDAALPKPVPQDALVAVARRLVLKPA